MCRRRQEAQQMGKTPWPPDWGAGDASRFIEFPELPKSRTQLVPPEKARRIPDRTPERPRLPTRVEGPLLQDADDLSSADLDAMIFKRRPYERPRDSHK